MNCKKCGYVMNEECKFCPGCGAEVESMNIPVVEEEPVCPECKQPVDGSFAFCSVCGATLHEATCVGTGASLEKVEHTGVAPTVTPRIADTLPVVGVLPEDLTGVLRVISSAGCGREFEVRDNITIGKDSSAEIHLPLDSYISHLHARIFVKDGKATIQDLDSRNGILLQVQEHDLQQGDRLLLGTTVFEFVKNDVTAS